MDINSLNGTTGSVTATGGVSLPAVVVAGSGSTPEPAAPVQTAVVQDAPKAPPSTPSIEQVKQAVQQLNQSFSQNDQGVQFSIDQTSNRVVVKVMDEKTHEVLRQIPSEELLELSRALDQKLGKLIHQQA